MNADLNRKAAKALQIAKETAGKNRRKFIETDHMLFGLAKVKCGLLAHVLAQHHMSLPMLVGVLEHRMRKSRVRAKGKFRTSFLAQKAFDGAHDAANLLGDAKIGTEHLLLGLLQYPQGPAGLLLHDIGITHEKVLTAIVQRTIG